MALSTIFVLILCFLIVSVLCAMLGLGGGVLYTPLQLLFGVDFHRAASTSLLLVILASFSAALVYHKNRRIDWFLVVLFEIPAMIGGFFGGYTSEVFSEETLSLLFVFVASIAGYAMFWKREQPVGAVSHKSGFPYVMRNYKESSYSMNILLIFFIGLLEGYFVVLIGTGGGPVIVPILVIVFGVPMEVAVASSIVMVIFNASAGLLGHTLGGHFDPSLAFSLGAVTMLGGVVGARISLRVPDKILRKSFGVVLFVVAFIVFLRGYYFA